MKLKNVSIILMFLFVAGLQLKAQEHELAPKHHGRLFMISSAVLGAVTVMDVQSTAGKQELNMLLANQSGRSGLSSSAIVLKAGMIGGAIGLEYLFLRKHSSSEKWISGINFAMAGVVGVTVIHNYGVKGR
jgi:hypothetical protein